MVIGLGNSLNRDDSIERLAQSMERTGFNDYVRYLSDAPTVIRRNFLAGLARGLGMAIGFSILGAVAIYLLRRAAYRNIPLIGDFIWEIVKIIQNKIA